MGSDEGSSYMDPLKGFLLTYLMPESCYDQFFLNFNFLDGECLSLFMYKITKKWLVDNDERHCQLATFSSNCL